MMLSKRYDAHVTELIRTVEEKSAGELGCAAAECEELFEIAEQLGDDALAGFACFYHGDIYSGQQSGEESMEYLTQALQHLKKTEEWELLVRCYSHLGILFQYEGDMSNAIDSFYAGLDVAEAHQVKSAGTIYMNFSSFCEDAKDYDRALFYRIKSLHAVEKLPESEMRNDYLAAVSAMLLRLYMKMDHLEEAGKMAQYLSNLQKEYGQLSCGFGIYVNQLEYIRRVGDSASEASIKKHTMEAFWNCPNLLEYFDECKELIHYLKRTQDYVLLEQVLDYIDKTLAENAKNTESIREVYLKVLTEKILLYKKTGNEEKQYRELQKYFWLERKRADAQRESMCSLLKLRSTLRQTEIEKMFLTQQADMDALTGIPNRRKMNEQADRLFEKAMREKQMFGMAMLDLDHFKYCNDTYGHHIGDKCLIKFANILKEQADENQQVFRYGGDEFMILFDNLPDEEIKRRCRLIQKEVISAAKELGLEKLTTSVGVANWVPRKGNQVWDYASAADQTLYLVKKSGRNNVRLVHYIEELKEEKGEFTC